ncbi:MAG: hypothetical protein E6G89_01160 [Alphaproteobacteria bacterium]|nr:MAG: hypothetical protein E6G89_01160 [Alphaproteobacteria bacterium]
MRCARSPGCVAWSTHCHHNARRQGRARLASEHVDTLGAGDGFIAAFLLATLKGEAIEAALNRGAEYAAHVCTYRGAFGYETPIRPGQPGLVHPAPTSESERKSR